MTTPIVLARRPSSDPRAHWEARLGDRRRLEVVLVTQPSAEPIIVPILSDRELKELLADAPAAAGDSWTCAECGAENDVTRRWCRVCSSHAGGN